MEVIKKEREKEQKKKNKVKREIYTHKYIILL